MYIPNAFRTRLTGRYNIFAKVNFEVRVNRELGLIMYHHIGLLSIHKRYIEFADISTCFISNLTFSKIVTLSSAPELFHRIAEFPSLHERKLACLLENKRSQSNKLHLTIFRAAWLTLSVTRMQGTYSKFLAKEPLFLTLLLVKRFLGENNDDSLCGMQTVRVPLHLTTSAGGLQPKPLSVLLTELDNAKNDDLATYSRLARELSNEVTRQYHYAQQLARYAIGFAQPEVRQRAQREVHDRLDTCSALFGKLDGITHRLSAVGACDTDAFVDYITGSSNDLCAQNDIEELRRQRQQLLDEMAVARQQLITLQCEANRVIWYLMAASDET